VCVCSLRYAACIAHAPCCHLWPFRFYNIFSTLSHKRRHFRKKKLLNINLCFDCLYNFGWNVSHYKKKWARCDHKSILVFMRSTRYSCLVLMKLELLDRFSKNTKMWNFIKISPVGTELFRAAGRTDGQTGKHGEANSRFLQFCECASISYIFKFE
jgi:hypothetical protein